MYNILKLNNGLTIPTIGLGTYKSRPGEVERAVQDAIDVGYRHFDCAWIYGNETEVGKALQDKINQSVVKREDLFITSKLWNNFHEKESVVPQLKESLSHLGLKYVDLYLIHWPMGFKKTALTLPTNGSKSYTDVDYLETWKGMEECLNLGLTRSIGLSNFNQEQIQRILANCTIKPVVNQIEVNPNLNQKDLIQFCKERDIVVVAFCPLGRSNLSGTPGFPEPTIFDPKVIEIGKKYNKTAAQVVLRYLVRLGVGAVPKSTTKARIAENIDIFDFDLDADDISYLDSCNKNMRISPAANYTDHKYYPF